MPRPAFSICLCPDSQLLRNRLDALLAAHPPVPGGPGGLFGTSEGVANGGGTWQRHVFWGDEGIAPAFWEHLTLQGLFAAPKALIFRNVQVLNAQTLRQLSEGLEPLAGGKSPLIWPILCLEVGFEKGKAKVPAHILRLPCYLTAEKNGWLDAIPGLTPQNLPTYIRAEASRQGLTLQAGEIGFLAQALPPDAAAISSELGKLALAATADGRLPDLAAALSGQTQELGIFELLRSIQHNNAPQAVWRRILEDRLSGENMVFAFNAIVLREGRALWQILAGSTPAMPPQAIAGKQILAKSLGFSRIARIWELALQADKGIKTGERSPEQSFEILTAELFTLFQGINDAARP